MRSVLMPLLLLAAVPLASPDCCPSQRRPDPPHREWKASWITHPTAPLREPVVLHFRRSLTLNPVPASYVVRVSADNRFILFVNGQRVGDGPARGDLGHWRYERFDLAPLLKPGENLITATVWNWGVYAPVAQMSDRTAFLLESEATGTISISTPEGWMVEEERGPLAARSQHRHPQGLLRLRSRGGNRRGKVRLERRSASVGLELWVPAATPMRDSIFPGVEQSALRRYHRRQFLGAGPGHPAATWNTPAPVPVRLFGRMDTGPAHLSRAARDRSRQ